MSIFKCKMCGGALDIEEGISVIECEYCGTKQTLPRLDDDRRMSLYDRANHFRRNNEFDKAERIYEDILNEDNTDAEAYWSLVLCRYGIEYVEDPTSHKRIPTINRAQFTSIFDDDNYKSALKYADGYQRQIYEDEAKAINSIHKEILAIAEKEEAFDVFICYKETDNNGSRTHDSVLANDLYYQLKEEGFKVFFSRITLEDKLGSAYEPYIFAALNSAKVMVVIGSKQEHFNAVWVKNEWSRYLALIKKGEKKMLIPAYKDMDPYDLPEEFSHLQAQDMSKLGFMQDLIRGIEKIVNNEEGQTKTIKESVAISENSKISNFLKRAKMFLEDGDFKSAGEYCEKILDIEPENAEAYFVKMMAYFKVTDEESLAKQPISLGGNTDFQKALRFGDDDLKSRLKNCLEKSEKILNLTTQRESLNRELDSKTRLLEKEKDFIVECEKITRERTKNHEDNLRSAKGYRTKKNVFLLVMAISAIFVVYGLSKIESVHYAILGFILFIWSTVRWRSNLKDQKLYEKLAGRKEFVIEKENEIKKAEDKISGLQNEKSNLIQKIKEVDEELIELGTQKNGVEKKPSKDTLFFSHGISPVDMVRIKALLDARSELAATIIIRQVTGMSLSEAKNFIAAYYE